MLGVAQSGKSGDDTDISGGGIIDDTPDLIFGITLIFTGIEDGGSHPPLQIEKEGVVKDKCYLSSWDEEKKEIVAIFGNLPKSYDELEASYQCDKE